MMKREISSRYAARGVSASKGEVHAAVDRLDPGLFPGAFCKILPDTLSGDPAFANVIHADGSGTKSILAYLYYRETGDPSVFAGIAQDSIVMNIDDLLCVGATGPILISSTVNRNARNFPGEALAALIEGTEQFLQHLQELGVNVANGGGETADVGDLTGTVTVDTCAVARLPRKAIVDNARIEPGLEIVGLSSAGRASYEDVENSGIGSNGLTSARHDLLHAEYRQRYPETVDPNTDPKLVYSGPHRLDSPLRGSDLTVGQAILSPTRTYAPVVRELLSSLGRSVRGLVHCSGGGQTKCLRFGRNVHFIKDQLFELPPVFREIQRVSGTRWKEMYQVFNMGHRMEVYVKPSLSGRVIRIADSFGIRAQIIGRTEASHASNKLTIYHGRQKLSYT